MMARYLSLSIALSLLFVGCGSEPADTPSTMATTIGSFGANPNPVPANVAVQFSWTVQGSGLTCLVDVDNDGTTDYTVNNCSSSSRASHLYGVQGSYLARLKVTGTDGLTREQTETVTVGPANTAPSVVSFTASTGSDLSKPNQVTFNWMVSDPNSDVTQCYLDAESDGVWEYDGLCSGLASSTSQSIKPANVVTYHLDYVYGKAGKYTATLEARDPYSSGSATIPVRVPYNRAPVIDSFTAVSGGNLVGKLHFAVSDPDGDPLSCWLTVESIGSFRYARCNTLNRVFNFENEGTYRITLEVTDSYNTTTRKTVELVFKKPIPALVERLQANERLACVLRTNGKTYCWGQNIYGQLGVGGDNPPDRSNVPLEVVMPSGATRFTQIAVGFDHACGLGDNKLAYCWGRGDDGRLGNGGPGDRPTPFPVTLPGGVTFTQITTGGFHSCAMGTDANAYCWGDNDNGETGVDNGLSDVLTPTLVTLPAGATRFTNIFAGQASMTCGVGDNSIGYCWGLDESGQLGYGGGNSKSKYFTPGAVISPPGGGNYTRFYSGSWYTCGKTSNNEHYCWGKNESGNLGNGTITLTPDSTPHLLTLPGGAKIRQLALGAMHACALSEDLQLYCWGNNDSGQFGDGTYNSSLSPRLIPTPVPFEQIAAQGYATCGLDLDDHAYCWGKGENGALGNGSDSDKPIPSLLLLPPL